MILVVVGWCSGDLFTYFPILTDQETQKGTRTAFGDPPTSEVTHFHQLGPLS